MTKPSLKGYCFAPAVRLMDRLTYPRKFLLFSVLFGVPLLLVTYFLFGEINNSLEISRRQTLGLRYLEATQPLFRRIQEHKEAQVSTMTGAETEARRKRELKEVTEGFATLQAAQREIGPLLGTAARFDAVKRHFENLSYDLGREGGAGTDDLREPVLQAMKTLMIHAGDASRLILDDDLSTYYLVDTVLFNLPSTQLFISQIRSAGEPITHLQSVSIEDRARLNVLEGRVQGTQAAINHAVKRAFELSGRTEVKGTLEPALTAAAKAVDGLLGTLTNEILNTAEVKITPAAWRQVGTEALTASFRLWDASSAELRTMLDRRIQRYWTEKVLVQTHSRPPFGWKTVSRCGPRIGT